MAMMQDNPYAQAAPAPEEMGQEGGGHMQEMMMKLDYIIQLLESVVSEEQSDSEDEGMGGEAQRAGDDTE